MSARINTDRHSATAVAGNANSQYTATRYTQLLYGQVVLTTDATVANRRVILQILDENDDVVIDSHAGAVVAASASDQHHEFLQGIYRETSFIGDSLQVPIGGDWLVPPGWKFSVDIENGVAGDSYDVEFVVKLF